MRASLSAGYSPPPQDLRVPAGNPQVILIVGQRLDDASSRMIALMFWSGSVETPLLSALTSVSALTGATTSTTLEEPIERKG